MKLLLAWLLADFISGLVHWWEDRALVGSSRFDFVNGVRADNDRHHEQPSYFLKLSWWENINTTAPFAWIASLFFFSDPFFDGSFLGWTTLFLGFGNLVHRWAHEHPSRLPIVVRWLQRTGLMIGFYQHGEHHWERGKTLSRNEAHRRYCVMSAWLNPFLDWIRFFDLLEWICGTVRTP